MKKTLLLLATFFITASLAQAQRNTPERIAEASQMNGLRKLRSTSSVPVTLNLQRGAVRFAMFNVRVPSRVGAKPEARASWFLNEHREALRVKDPKSNLQLTRRSPDGEFVFYRRTHKGIPIFPGGLAVLMDGTSVRGVSGNYVPDIDVSPVPRLTAGQAESIALMSNQKHAHVHGDTTLRYLNLGLLGLPDHKTYLAWRVHLMSSKTTYVDAHTGKLLFTTSHVRNGFDLELDSRNGDPMMETLPCGGAERWFEEGGPVSGANPSADGWMAFNNITNVDAYFRNTFGRDGYDGEGDDVEIYVHVGDENGNRWNDAHYFGCCDLFEFGNGIPVRDVVGHEFTHGVSAHSAEFIYGLESGALDESFADIFGHFVDNNDWTIGENTGGVGWRNMQDPAAVPWNHPDRYSQKVPIGNPPVLTKANDYGWVHRNAGINNKAAFLIIAGQNFNSFSVSGIGHQKAQRLFYAVLTRWLTENSQMIDARYGASYYAALWSASGKHNFTVNDLCQVMNAYAAVELGNGDRDCSGFEDASSPMNDDGSGANDNCPNVDNPGQYDWDGDGLGNECDDDMDGDGRPNNSDNCYGLPNAGQENFDGDALGDRCDNSDGPQFDTYEDFEDNCPTIANEDQVDTDSDGKGDACDPDDDNDGDPDGADNCKIIVNPNQSDSDGDKVGDACDLCQDFPAQDNRDTDGDGKGNPCDPDDDGDTIPDGSDNCPLNPNKKQTDMDGDGVGFACDANERETLKEGALMMEVTREPFIIPVPVCPDCGILIPNLYEQVVIVEAPADFDVRIMNSEGRSVTNGKRGMGRHVLRFQPPPHGGSALRLNVATMLGQGASGNVQRRLPLDKPAPDELRYYLVVTPSKKADMTKGHRVSFKFERSMRSR